MKLGPFPTNSAWNSSVIQAWLDRLRTIYNNLLPISSDEGKYLRDDSTWAYPATVYTLASDISTAASTDPVSLTGLSWDFEPNATYVFRFVGNVSPATATTGCGFQLLVT